MTPHTPQPGPQAKAAPNSPASIWTLLHPSQLLMPCSQVEWLPLANIRERYLNSKTQNAGWRGKLRGDERPVRGGQCCGFHRRHGGGRRRSHRSSTRVGEGCHGTEQGLRPVLLGSTGGRHIVPGRVRRPGLRGTPALWLDARRRRLFAAHARTLLACLGPTGRAAGAPRCCPRFPGACRRSSLGLLLGSGARLRGAPAWRLLWRGRRPRTAADRRPVDGLWPGARPACRRRLSSQGCV